MKKFRNTFIASMLSLFICGNVQAGINDGLVAHYPFDGDAKDASENGNDGTVYGAILTEDRFGQGSSAYLFDGVDDSILISEIGITADISFSAWFKHHKPNNKSRIAITMSNNDGWLVDFKNGLRFAVGDGQNFSVAFNQDEYYTDGNWHHVVGIHDTIENIVKLYVDNILISTSSGSYTYTSKELYIGDGHLIDENNVFDGIIDDIRIYNRALSEAEVQELYQKSLTPKELINDLANIVITLNLQQGISNSLDAKLETTIKALDDLNENNDIAAINSLNAFINAVEAQRCGKITCEDGDMLIAKAQVIIEKLESM